MAREYRHVSAAEVRAMICADCGKELQEDEVYVCDSCDQEQRKFIDSVMGEDDDG
ncbi:protein NinF [Serratia entomophila]|uniref:protein NinF n=1 Tax=Serratia entomophila TaxID=42906 RepID=UPI0036F44289